jgi:primosomal protein N' (replication factor Y) (superfamily II helicase)
MPVAAAGDLALDRSELLQGSESIVDVALQVPALHAYSYRIPARMNASAMVGARCIVTLRGKRTVGVIVARRAPRANDPKLADLIRVVDTQDYPALSTELVHFARELAAYYFAPLGEAMRLFLPPEEARIKAETAELSLFPTAHGAVSPRQVLWVAATLTPAASEATDTAVPVAAAAAPAKALTPKQRLLLAHVRAESEVAVHALGTKFPSARSMLQRLETMGLVRFFSRELEASAFFRASVERDTKPVLNQDQQRACDALEPHIGSGAFCTFLLHGVTGSGKTEVYLRAVECAKAAGVASIVLVPEIALTPQLVGRFRARFGDEVAVIHSGLTEKERFVMWWKLRRSEVDVVIGARSALFAPLSNVGLIVVDEEHDSSFKQEEGVRYHARDMAILRAHQARAVCILGSATPSLESLELTRAGRATKLRLPDRATSQVLPKVELIDLRKYKAGPTGDKRLTVPLLRAIEETLGRGEQTILFLNRRGFAPSALCESCGETAECPHCSVALTFHKRAGAVLRCHYCDYERAMTPTCTSCSVNAMLLDGLGTEKLEETLSHVFPAARVARLDRDVAGARNTERILESVRRREVDILVGTQMVTKGHDLPSVTLVGVINADAALSLPDFRASERAFQLLVQVAGRAGRGETPGRVLVQTHDTKHAAIRFAMRHDVDGFLAAELEERRALAYPPFSRLALLRTDALDEQAALAAAETLATAARAAATAGVEVLGPSAAPLARLRNRFRFRVMLRAKSRAALRTTLMRVLPTLHALHRDVRAQIDIDPIQLL